MKDKNKRCGQCPEGKPFHFDGEGHPLVVFCKIIKQNRGAFSFCFFDDIQSGPEDEHY